MLTMLIGGLWHGASWTFVAWGGIHGLYLLLTHFVGAKYAFFRSVPALVSIPFTFLLVALAWVPFRAASFDGVLTILHAAVSGDMVAVDGSGATFLLLDKVFYLFLMFSAVVVWAMPNSNFCGNLIGKWLMEGEQPRFGLPVAGLVFGALLFMCLSNLSKYSTFIYFQF